jgi:uncharacterized membrane protein
MINEKRVMARRFGTRQITTIGMLSAISIILGVTRLGFIPIPPVNATIMHVPVIIGAILEGPVVGAMIGLIFGVFSIIQAITAPNILSFAFINPLVSVLPRVLIGITSYYVYKGIFVKNEAFKVGLGAAIGSLTNTVGVLGMIYLLYAARYAKAVGISTAAAAKTIFGIATINGLPEACLAVIITIPVVLAINKIRK